MKLAIFGASGRPLVQQALPHRGDRLPKLTIPGWRHADLSLEGFAKRHF
jgi:hypothetical protein